MIFNEFFHILKHSLFWQIVEIHVSLLDIIILIFMVLLWFLLW